MRQEGTPTRQRYDHNAVLDLWASAAAPTTRAIAKLLRLRTSRAVESIINTARKRGDARAAFRMKRSPAVEIRIPMPAEGHPQTPRDIALRIVERVAATHGVSCRDIFHGSRHPALLLARHDAYSTIARSFETWTIVRIAKFFGRHHTTIIHSFRRFGYPHNHFAATNRESFRPRFSASAQPVPDVCQDDAGQLADASHPQVLLQASAVKHEGKPRCRPNIPSIRPKEPSSRGLVI